MIFFSENALLMRGGERVFLVGIARGVSFVSTSSRPLVLDSVSLCEVPCVATACELPLACAWAAFCFSIVQSNV